MVKIKNKPDFRLPVRSYFMMGTAAAVIVSFLFCFNYTSYLLIQKIEVDIVTAKSKLQIQQKLSPLYMTLNKMLVETKQMTLPYPEKKILSIDDFGDIPSMIEEITKQIDSLEIKSITPEVNPAQNDTGKISVEIGLQGKFMAFREFLSDIGGLASFHKIESVQIETIQHENFFLITIILFVTVHSQFTEL